MLRKARILIESSMKALVSSSRFRRIGNDEKTGAFYNVFDACDRRAFIHVSVLFAAIREHN